MRSESRLYSRYFTYIKPVARLPIVKNYSSTIFTLVMMTIFLLFAIKPTVETILVLQKKLADADEILQKVTQKTNNLSLGKTNYDNLDQNIKNKISSAIPDTVSLRSVISPLEQIAKLHEASISALQIQPLTIDTKTQNPIGEITEISFTLNMEGSYRNLLAFLQDLKTSSRLISIDRLSLAKVGEGAGLIMSISGKAYYLK